MSNHLVKEDSTKEKEDPKNDEEKETVIEIKDITEPSKHNSIESIITKDVDSLKKEVNAKGYIEMRISSVNKLKRDVEKAKDKDGNKERNVFNSRNKLPTVWVQYNVGIGGADQGGGFDYDPHSRNSFVKLVFMLLTIMLMATAGLVMAVLFIPELNEFYMECGRIYLLLSLGLMLGLNLAMACCGCTRMPPFNYICLFLTVILMSNIVAFLSVRYRMHILCLAFAATAVTMFFCTLLACSSFDFTKWYLYVVVIAVAFCAISLIISLSMFLMKWRFKPLQLVILFVGALINVVMMVIELQMILGGRSIELGESDYALGAYLLYTSIISLFLDLLQMIGLLDD